MLLTNSNKWNEVFRNADSQWVSEEPSSQKCADGNMIKDQGDNEFMMNIVYKNIAAFMINNKEHITLTWEEDGQFSECTLTRQFDTSNPWKIKSSQQVTKDLLNELFRQFVEQLEIE